MLRKSLEEKKGEERGKELDRLRSGGTDGRGDEMRSRRSSS